MRYTNRKTLGNAIEFIMRTSSNPLDVIILILCK